MIVKLLVQLKGTGADFFLRVAEFPIEDKQELIVDEAVILEILGHILQGIPLVDGDGNYVVGLGQGQHIVCGKPHHHRQHHRGHQHTEHIRHGAF